MTTSTDIKRQVREFYDQVGWQEVSEGTYQNAHYEDLRPVAREYVHRCHLRVLRHLRPGGRYLLDAGSGPIQYPEYLEYSRGYQYRVCADISIQALQEARKRIGSHGLFAVADIANLPFSTGAFEGVVSLHTIHHLPEDEHLRAYQELYRSLARGSTAVVVTGWPDSRLMKMAEPLIKLSNRLRNLARLLAGKTPAQPEQTESAGQARPSIPKGTFINRHGVEWVKNEVGRIIPVKILVWRSVNVRFLRSLVHSWLGGRYWLRLLYWLEERSPEYFGENGQYPLIVIHKDNRRR
jgi:SAM-dependent methyltransferase